MCNSMQGDDAVLKVFGWRVQTRAAKREVLVRLPFVRPDGQAFKGASTDRIYAFGPDQAREMSRALREASNLVFGDEVDLEDEPPAPCVAPPPVPPPLPLTEPLTVPLAVTQPAVQQIQPSAASHQRGIGADAGSGADRVALCAVVPET